MVTRLILAGGFLGAGKTTLLLKAAQLLRENGYRVGMITNDQAEGLVDTELARRGDVPVFEVAGGCFCCRFPNLLASIQTLKERVAPDIILAEPVGSCTDLMATVLRPLQAYAPDALVLAPLTILVDPERDVGSFPATVDYLYNKQMAEAEVVVLSKCDVVETGQRETLRASVQHAFPSTPVVELSAATGEGVAAWLSWCLDHSSRLGNVLDLDYDRYAEAEAALGWLNASGTLSAAQPFSPIAWVERTLAEVGRACAAQQAPLAHVKLYVRTTGGEVKAGLTADGQTISWDLRTASDQARSARFILNARVNTAPETLAEIVREASMAYRPHPAFNLQIHQIAAFRPLRPRPTYRLNAATIALLPG
jgi:G3E family GTPase